MQWKLKHTLLPENVDDVQAILLSNRSIEDEHSFFQPPAPWDLTLEKVGINSDQVTQALQRLEIARQEQQDIVIFGDYDADGVSSTAIMWETMSALGFNVRPFIPHREKHGYGMSDRSLGDLLAGAKPAMIITVDNGIVAHVPIQQLQAQGIDVILTDHHQPEAELPGAHAIVHTTQLCGATVSWIFSREIAKHFAPALHLDPRELMTKQLDLTAIATIADQVPLVNANRSFAFHGLKALKKTKRLGLLALMEKAGIALDSITTSTVNFAIAPRINAMGRLAHSLEALRLVCTKNHDRAQQLVELLNDTNTRRQDLTQGMIEHAKNQAHVWEGEHLIIVASEEYHEGVIGLIAGKLMEEFYKPAIAISIGQKSAKASARSIPGVNIVDLIRQVKDELLEVGGHPMAAGFSVEVDKIANVSRRLYALAKDQITAGQLQPSLDVECLVPFELISKQLIEVTKRLDPCGQGNPEPVFGLQNVCVMDAFTMGNNGQHLKVVIQCEQIPLRKPTKGGQSSSSQTLNCLAWNLGHLAQQLLPGTVVDIAGVVELNEWKGRTSVQMKIKDLVIR
ncbi:MAG TPA: single-stranded-DNA-specific exonuclease RecJ [Vitreimonas sp.]|nr:single-stranded-DNA-specific exonuclease RecJ [Vitreimonas sp.]